MTTRPPRHPVDLLDSTGTVVLAGVSVTGARGWIARQGVSPMVVPPWKMRKAQ